MVSGAHEGGIFSICVLKDGTMVSGGGKDRKVALWDHSYKKQAEMEVRALQPSGVHKRHSGERSSRLTCGVKT